MRILNCLTHFRTLLALAVLLALSATAHSQTFALRTKDGKVVEHAVVRDGTVDVIVEFRDTPLLKRSKAQALQSLNARFIQFENDLRKMDAIASKSASRETSAPKIRRMFSRVFAGASVRTPQRLTASIAALPYVARVHNDDRMEILGDQSTRAITAVTHVRANAGGEGIVVAVIDTGIDYNHPALGGSLGPSFKV